MRNRAEHGQPPRPRAGPGRGLPERYASDDSDDTGPGGNFDLEFLPAWYPRRRRRERWLARAALVGATLLALLSVTLLLA